MRVLKDVKVRFGGREVTCTALFDTGSRFTVISRGFFERSFGPTGALYRDRLNYTWLTVCSLRLISMLR